MPRFARSWSVKLSLFALVLVLGVAVAGPFFSPYSSTELPGLPYSPPGGDFLLGTDFLGRDVLSRILAGGRSVVVLAGLATIFGYALGATIGLVAGYSRSLVDPVLMRAMDVLLAFPPILFLLLLAAGAGASPVLVVVGIAVIQAPGIARVIRTATLEISVKAYVEEGPTGALIGDPRHPYTHGLISSVPDHVEPRALSGIPGVAVGVGDRPSGCAFAPRCSMRVAACDEGVPALTEAGTGRRVRCIRWQETPEVTIRRRSLPDPPDGSGVQPLLDVESLRATFGSRDREVVAADGVTFTMEMGECLALVGESGSGKTTIARCIVGLHRPAGGRLSFDGRALEPLARQRSKEERRRIQIVFQNPYESLNPRHTVEATIKSAALFFRRMGRSEARREVDELLGKVRLPGRLAARYPSELSGGECQRVAIARALAAQPDLLVCDEVTSALDVSVQAAVLELLNELRAELGLSLLFITHDLGVVASVADRVLVLQQGVVQERGSTTEILTAPQHAYTRRLTSSAPSLSAAAPCRG